MAICIPESNIDFATKGEEKVFSVLKKLPNTCIVYYEVIIGERDLRPDFVVVDNERGITILEVKDWGVDTIAKATPKYFEIHTKQGRLRQRKNPEIKTKLYLEEMREQLSIQDALCDDKGRLSLEVQYYVVLPNLSKKEFDEEEFSKVLSPDKVILYDDLKSAEEFIEKYEKEFKKLENNIPGNKINGIRLALFPELKLPGSEQWFTSEKSKGSIVTLESGEQEFGLSIEQEQIAKSLGSGPRLLHGIAGTGKTLILLFHAKLSSSNSIASGRKPKILILCWNISLAQYMRHAYSSFNFNDPGEVEIRHFASFAGKMIGSAREVEFPKIKGNDNFDSDLTEALNQVPVKPYQQYDIIYIDEAQDFQKDWIKFVFDKLLTGEPSDRNLVLSGDYAQHIYKYRDFASASGFTWKSIGIPMVGRTKILKKIYRNSARVWAFAAAFLGNIIEYYKDDEETKIEFAPKRGFDPQLIECSSLEEQLEKAVEIVSRLPEHNYSPRNALILYKGDLYKGKPFVNKLLAKLRDKNIQYQWITEDRESKATFKWSEESVKVSTVASAKGMDAPVVIILAAESFRDRDGGEEDEEKVLYVALTRAREFLTVLHTGNTGMVPRLTEAMQKFDKLRKRIIEVEEKANKDFYS